MRIKKGARFRHRALTVSGAVLYAIYGARAYSAAGEPPPTAAAPESSAGLSEVIVSARRRDENILDVPVAVTAFSADDLRANNFQRVEDLQLATPSLSFTGSQNGFAPLVTIRGQSPVSGSGPAVVFYMDEVPMPTDTNVGSSLGGPGFFFDLDNVEVLKGPQGTLFGRNTTGGAILIQTARPKNEFGGYVRAGYGNYADREVDAAINIPVVDEKLLTRIAVSYQDQGGYTNVLGQSDRPLDNIDRKSVRVSITYKPTGSVQNDFIATVVSLSSNGSSMVLSSVANKPAYPNLPQLLAQQQGLGIRTVLPTDWPNSNERSYIGVSDIFKIEFSPSFTFKNILSYAKYRYQQSTDWDATTYPIFEFTSGTPSWIRYENYTEEPQIQGAALHGNLTYTAGAFYLNQPAGDFYGSSTIVMSGADSILLRQQYLSRALYAQGTYDLSSLAQGLQVTAGTRYTWDHSYAAVEDLGGFYSCGSGCSTQEGAASFASPTWTFDVDYHFTPNTMLYFATRRGFRDGGFNTIAGGILKFDPEHLTDFELGTKSEWSIGGLRARTSADVFLSKYTDIQIPVAIDLPNGAQTTVVQNAAAGRISGVELEAQLFPTRSLQLGMTLSGTNFSYTEVAARGTLPAVRHIPKWKYSFNGKYTLPTPDRWGELNVNANWGWTDDNYIGGRKTAESLQTAYGLLNLGLQWNRLMDSAFDFSLFANNALNKDYKVFNTGISGARPASAIRYGAPRMYGVRVGYTF